MRYTPRYVVTDPDEVKRLVRAHPWATFVSPASTGLVASHYPVLLDESADEIVLVSHFGRPDEIAHELGAHEVLVIVQGPHDYVSSSWYSPGEVVPTWNHVTAHLYGVPEILDDEENYRMLSQLTDHFEAHRPGGRSLADDEAGTRRAAKGTVGLRIRVTRYDARAKLSQNKDPDVVRAVIEHLEPGNPALAGEMRRAAGSGGVTLDGRARRIAEVIADELPHLAATAPPSIRILLGTLDLEDGHDESYVHAHLVELLDGVRASAPDAAVTLVGFPAVAHDLTELRRACEASAQVTAETRGIRFSPADMLRPS